MDWRLVKNVWNTKEGTMTMNETQRTKYKEDEEYRKKRNTYKTIVIKLPSAMFVIHQWKYNVIQDI